MNYRFLLLIAFALLSVAAYPKSKSDRLRPQWVTKQVPNSKSGSYMFVNAQGSGYSLDAARQSAVANLTTRLERERGLKINTAVKTNSRMTTNSKYTEYGGAHSSYKYQETQDLSMEVIENGEPIKIICRTIDEYWVLKDGVYTMDILYTVADKNQYGGSYDDKITTTTKYPWAGVLSIIPGAGQMYKGDFAKGVPFLVAGVAGATGIVLCESTRQAYRAKAVQQPQYAQQYQTRANNWATGSYVCMGITGGIWIWNIVDAIVAKGARRVKVESQYRGFSVIPAQYYDPVNHTYDSGIGFAFAF